MVIQIRVERSGSLNIRNIGIPSNIINVNIVFTVLIFSSSILLERKFAKNMISKALDSSEGWKVIPAIVNHLVALLTVEPAISTSKRSADVNIYKGI